MKNNDYKLTKPNLKKPMLQLSAYWEGQYELEIFYGNAPQRVKSTLKHDGQLQKTILYYSDYEIEKTINEPQRNLHYIIAPTGIAAIVEKKENLNYPVIYNTFTDYLGSLTHVVESGTLVDEISYDAWGRKRNPANIDEYEEDMETPPTHIFSRGYTFHEHLNEFKLINMNARLYDPTLGRMLSPDNFVTNASNSQDYNSYSYARNNPLKFTDPTGNVVRSNPSWGPDGADYDKNNSSRVFGEEMEADMLQFEKDQADILLAIEFSRPEGGYDENTSNNSENTTNAGTADYARGPSNDVIDGEAASTNSTEIPGEIANENGDKKKLEENENSNSEKGSETQSAGAAMMGFMAADVMLPDPSDVYVPKWIAYGVLGTAISLYIYVNPPPILEMSRYKNGMKGGKQKDRDRGFKGRPKAFKDWIDLHGAKSGSDRGAPDFDDDYIDKEYEKWKKLNRPGYVR